MEIRVFLTEKIFLIYTFGFYGMSVEFARLRYCLKNLKDTSLITTMTQSQKNVRYHCCLYIADNGTVLLLIFFWTLIIIASLLRGALVHRSKLSNINNRLNISLFYRTFFGLSTFDDRYAFALPSLPLYPNYEILLHQFRSSDQSPDFLVFSNQDESRK